MLTPLWMCINHEGGEQEANGHPVHHVPGIPTGKFSTSPHWGEAFIWGKSLGVILTILCKNLLSGFSLHPG